MDNIIFHHYPPSPVAEKVRVGLGIKQLNWQSVTIPRIPPKPLLMPLTGGYRRTPVMQIGADVYCDSICILREIQKRHPEPSFHPGGADGLVWALSRWTDSLMFDLAVKLVLSSAADQMPKELADDRGRLYLGPDWNYAEIAKEIPHLTAQLRAQFSWIEQRLSGDRPFMLGDNAALPDALAYYLVWFIRGRWEKGPEFFSQFPAIEVWEERVKAIGHGTPVELSAEDALAIAKSSELTTPEYVDSDDPLNLSLGMEISIAPDADSGEEPVTGRLRYADKETIGLLHENADVGEICINFPRVGYRITTA